MMIWGIDSQAFAGYCYSDILKKSSKYIFLKETFINDLYCSKFQTNPEQVFTAEPLLKGHYVMRKRDAYPAELPPDTLKYGVIGQ